MPRLIVNPGSPTAAEFQLRPGVNRIGRAPANDIQIPDGSISGTHCQITVEGDSFVLRDLGSTNGTFIRDTPVAEAALEHGQAVRLGQVEMVFYGDAVQPVPAPAARAPVLALAGAGSDAVTATIALASPVAAATSPLAVGAQYCRFHPKMPARYTCPRCQHFFCEACVATHSAGGQMHKSCRRCGEECVPVVTEFAAEIEKGFLARLPGAFLYPLRGVGVLIVIVGIVLVALLKLGQAAIAYGSLRMIMFGIIMEVFAGGYLFTYLQAIIHSTENGERELPDLPGISNFLDDVIVPFGRLLALGFVCFAPAGGLAVWLLVNHQTALAPALIGAVLLGYLYFPMAFLAVATLDTIGGADPLVVVPSMIRAPAEYLLSLLMLAAVAAVQTGGSLLLKALFPESWTIHSMGGLVAMWSLMAFLSFLSLYLLIVAVHLLGLIFVTKKQPLAWLDR